MTPVADTGAEFIEPRVLALTYTADGIAGFAGELVVRLSGIGPSEAELLLNRRA